MSEEMIVNPTNRSSDDAVPITGVKEFIEVFATRCEEDNSKTPVDGGMIFGDDVSLKRFDEVETFPRGTGGHVVHGIVWRIKTQDEALLGHSVVTTTHPYASDWFEVTTFKRKTPTNHSKRELERQRWKLLLEARGDPAVLKEHPYDLAETNPKILTAALYAPQRSPEGLTTFRRSSASGDFAPARRLWGLCADYAGARRRLQLSSNLQKLVDAAEKGTLYFQFFSNRPSKSTSKFADSPRPVVLYPEVREKVPAVLDYAIDKALAGPLRGADWRGRPVAELAAAIFRAQLNNMNRRVNTDLHPRRARRTREEAKQVESGLPPIDELAARCGSHLDSSPDAPDALLTLEGQTASTLEDDDREQRLVGLAMVLALVERGRWPSALAARVRELAANATDARQQRDARTVLKAAVDRRLEHRA